VGTSSLGTRKGSFVANYEYSGGPVRRNIALYVERPADHMLLSSLKERRDIFIITAPRQTGKTSLWFNAESYLRANNFNAAMVDFREALGTPDESTASARGWTETLLRAVTRAFRLDGAELRSWFSNNDYRATTEFIVAFFEEFLRNHLNGPIVIAFDEIDVVQLYSYFTDNLFEALRGLAARRDTIDISFVLIGLNHPRFLLKRIHSGGFNISGLHIALDDFDATDASTVAAWAFGYPAENDSERLSVAKAILAATGGQPFLTSWLFEHARKSSLRQEDDIRLLVDDMLEDAKNGEGLASHFASAREIILERPNLAFKIANTIEHARQRPISARDLQENIRAALVSTGLMREQNRSFVIKSPIYQAFFDTEWISDLKHSIGREVFEKGPSRFSATSALRKNICIIGTGGMISMELRPDGKIDAPHDLAAHLRSFSDLSAIADFDSVPLMFKDSLSIGPEEWRAIAEAIYARRDAGYDGFVVLHGTDTLPFTASAVAFALGSGLGFPVVFVGSQTAPHVLHGDARINLIRACTVATQEQITEVVVVVSDQIHRAVCVQKRDDFRFDPMHAPAFEPLGYIADSIELNHALVRSGNHEFDLRAEFSHNVLKVSLYPGFDPGFLKYVLDNPSIEGIVVETQSFGSFPAEGKWSFIPFIERATAAGVPVLLTTQFPTQQWGSKYMPATPALAAGAINGGHMTPPAAITKFMWVLPQIRRRIEQGDILSDRKLSEIAKWMNLDFVGELGARKA
jgi:L-asparaginase